MVVVVSVVILLLLAALAFAFVVVVARHMPRPAAEAAAAGGAAPPNAAGPGGPRWQWSRRRGRARLGRSFREIRAFLRGVIPGRRYGYAVPWFLLIGESGAGKTALLDSVERASPVLLEPRRGIDNPGFCTWRFFDTGVVLDVDGALVRPASGIAADEADWQELLRLLRNYRPLRPLDGVVLAISCELLLAGIAEDRGAVIAAADNFYRRVWSLQQHLGLRLPIYIVLTKSDLVPGFAGFAQALAAQYGNEILGWSNPRELDAPLSPQVAAGALADIAARLRRIHLDIAADTDNLPDPDGLMVFPGAAQRLAAPLQIILDSLFRPSAYHEPFFLRGIYFTGYPAVPQAAAMAASAAAAPAPLPDERVFPARDRTAVAGLPAPAPAQPIFVRDLFTEKILAEPTLAAVARHGPAHLARNVRIAQGALVVSVVVLGTGLAVETVRLKRGIDSLIPALTAVDEGLESLSQGQASFSGPTSAQTERDARRFAGAESFLNGLSGSDLNGLWSPFIPTSWFSSLEDDAVDFLQAGFTHVLLPTIRHEIANRVHAALDKLSAPASTDTSSLAAPGTSTAVSAGFAGSPDFIRVETAIRALIALSTEADLFNQLNSRPELSLVSRLSSEMLDIKVPSSFYLNAKLYQAALSRSHVVPYDFTPIRPQVKDAVLTAFRPIEARFSDDGPILGEFTYLAAAFGNLEGAVGNGVDPGVMTVGLITVLTRTAHILDDPKLSWIMSDGVKNIPELDQLLTAMAQSPLFGPDLVDPLRSKLDADLKTMQQRLATASAPQIGPLLDQQNGRIALRLAPSLAQLSNQLNAMLKYAFMTPRPDSSTAAFNATSAGAITNWDVDTLRTALDFYRGYEQFETNELAAMPKALTKPLDNLARQRLRGSMIKAVSDAMTVGANTLKGAPLATAVVLDETAVFNQAESFRRAAPVLTDILAVANQLGFADFYQRLRGLAVTQAYGLLEEVDQLADADRLYLPQRPFSSLVDDTSLLQSSYLLRSDVEVAQYLDSQRDRIARLAHGIAEPAVGFLGRGDLGSSSSMPLVGKWRGILVALQSYQNGDPSGSVGSLQNFIRFGLADASRGNCPVTGGAGAFAADFFNQRLDTLQRQVAAVCSHVTTTATVTDYDRLGSLFNQLLGGRFPFGPDGTAPVEISHLAEFFQVFATQEAGVRASLAKSPDLLGTPEALQFLDQLDKASAFFAPILATPTTDRPGGYDLNVAFRVNPRHEHGGDEIIDWEMKVGDTVVRPDHPTARWFPGDPITVRLRWAKDSPLLPYARDGSVLVVDRTAIFGEEGRWSLLKLLRQHLAAPNDADPGTPDAVPHLLKFTIPVSVTNVAGSKPVTPEDQVVVYIRVALSAPGATGPKAVAPVLPEFPEHAPALSVGAPTPLFSGAGARAAVSPRNRMRRE